MEAISCAFCDLPEIHEREIIRNDLARAFLTNIPIVPGHVLIVPLRHVRTFDELTTEETSAIFDLRKRLKTALQKTFQAEGFNFAWNENKVAGQSVSHFHLHMLPRKEGDTGITEYEPRKFLYQTEGNRKESAIAELKSVAELLKKEI